MVSMIIEFESTENTLVIWTHLTRVPWLLWLGLETRDLVDVNGHLLL